MTLSHYDNKFIVTNFAYGTGPYLRATELAIAFNCQIEQRGHKRFKIIVPLVYGENQKAIMSEEFSGFLATYPDEIIFDRKLGRILRSVFYEGGSYGDYLDHWSKKVGAASLLAGKYLKSKYGNKIKVELNRSPRIFYDIAPSYFTSFGYIGEILEKTKNTDVSKVLKIPSHVLTAAIKQINFIEKQQKIHCLAFPGTFSYIKKHKPRYRTEVEVPPLVTSFSPPSRRSRNGKSVFVTVSGIPGLEKLYSGISKLGLTTYSNNPDAIPRSIKASPRIINKGSILFHFARSGWNSVWSSLLSETPLIVPNFDPSDDPEIYFNNISVRKLGLGVVYQGQTVDELLEEYHKTKNKNLTVKRKIFNRWGTFDGTKYCAKIFADDYLKNHG